LKWFRGRGVDPNAMRVTGNVRVVGSDEDGFLEAHAREVVAAMGVAQVRCVAAARPEEIALAPAPEIEQRLDVRRADVLRALLVRLCRERLGCCAA
jgi:hypothetical protein